MLIKYHLSIKFLNQKKTEFPVFKKFKTRAFQYPVNMVFHAKEIIILRQLFKHISYLTKVRNNNFLVTSKNGILCSRKYHRTSTFSIK